MSRNVIDASLDTIPKTRQFFWGLFCIEPTQYKNKQEHIPDYSFFVQIYLLFNI